MEHSNGTAEMLEKLSCPAFLTNNGIITCANRSALSRQIQINTDVRELICAGGDEYTQYNDGTLYIALCLNNTTYNASISKVGQEHLFCLTSDCEEPELRAFAVAAQYLREPLSNALLGIEELIPNKDMQNNPESMQHLSQINRSLHQLLRAVCSMSDASRYTNPQSANMQMQNLTKLFSEILEKAASLAADTGIKINYTIPGKPVLCLADAEKLERAVLNLISNAIKNTPKGGTIDATLRQSGSKLLFILNDTGNGIAPQEQASVFTNFLREPALGNPSSGIGLGMSIVRSVAAIHGGAVLIDHPGETGTRVTMTLAIKHTEEDMLRSPVLLPVDYSGGRDHALLELSDVLPNSSYCEIS